MAENTALAIMEETGSFLAPVADLTTILNAYQVKKDFIEKALRKDLDFGVIPGSTKPALYKPGAEKLANIYGFAPVFEDMQTIEDWTGEAHNGEPFFYYRQKCNLYKKGDRLVGSADGSCNSWEKKYRYREGQRLCPDCGQPTIFKSKPPKRGFYCWLKKGGCGAQFQENDKRITEQETGQIKNPDICDVTNTILKMSQKRALVAAILITTGASDYFTQDIDDFISDPDIIDVPFTETPARPEPAPQARPASPIAQPVTMPAEPTANPNRPSQAMLDKYSGLYEQAKNLGLTVELIEPNRITKEELAEKGKALRQRIEAAQAAAEPVAA
jgi:hypothetical protein